MKTDIKEYIIEGERGKITVCPHPVDHVPTFNSSNSVANINTDKSLQKSMK